MRDKVKILFPAFRILVCIAALIFASVFVDIDEWSWRMWCLVSFSILMLVWSVWGFVVILKRIIR